MDAEHRPAGSGGVETRTVHLKLAPELRAYLEYLGDLKFLPHEYDLFAAGYRASQAPALLAALEVAFEAARRSECYGCDMPRWQGCMSYCSGDRIGNAIPMMQAALAAARGDEADEDQGGQDGSQ